MVLENAIVPYAHVIHVAFTGDALEHLNNIGLSHIGRDIDTHWESSIFKVSKLCGDNTNGFARLVKLKAIKHHTQVNIGESFIGSSVVHYILDLRECVRIAHYHFIEFTEIRYPLNPAVLLGYDKTGEAPWRYFGSHRY